jgi:hypothetical protein
LEGGNLEPFNRVLGLSKEKSWSELMAVIASKSAFLEKAAEQLTVVLAKHQMRSGYRQLTSPGYSAP